MPSFLLTPLIFSGALVLISAVSRIVWGLWLSDLLAYIGSWELALVGSQTITTVLSWLLAVVLFIAAIRLLSKGKL